MSSFRKTAVFAAIGLASSLTVALAQTPTEINFGIISTETSSNLKKIWEPFLAEMSKETGLKINGFYASDYAGVIEAMRFNKVQVAWFGNKSAMEAVNRSNGQIFAQTVDSDGNPGYWSHLIVHKDSNIKNLDDVLKCDKTVDFGIGDPNSTSGFLVPTSYIFAAKNVDPKQCFKTIRNASHEANAMAVANKQVMVATNNSESLRRLQQTAPKAFANIKVIWTSPLIPSDPLVWRKDLAPDIKSKLSSWLLGYGRFGTPDELAKARKVMVALQWAPFNPSSDNQLLPIRKLAANKDLLKVQGDSKLSDAEKAKEVAEIKAKITAIEAQEKMADKDPHQKQITAFIAADKAGDKDALKKLIADLAAGVASIN
jgi:phosphonate transport system substrate-binding protein